ncbi:MAG: hypothetical protein K940chlam8_00776 [Chlamydiae bacterium]|nr:hypothetical protein [Chlamydiota bacterium]
MKKWILMCMVFALSFSEIQDMPEPYCSIKVLPFDGQGFLAPENKNHFKEMILSRDIHVVIELGSWIGSSTCWMAQFLPSDGKVYAVDHWLGDRCIDAVPEARAKYPRLYQQFLSNVIHKNLAHKIVPIRMKTTEAAKALNVKADLIYIDASHDEVSVFKDIIDWLPKLKENGIMCGDDWHRNFPGVVKAVERAAKLFNLTIHHDGQFWWYEPKRN